MVTFMGEVRIKKICVRSAKSRDKENGDMVVNFEGE